VSETRRPAPPRRTWRLASGLYGGVTLAMIVILAVFAITATQTPPPAIAEIAPQAAEQIKEAPESQSSSVGSAEGGLGGEASLETTTTTQPAAVPGVTTTAPPVIDRARVRRCVGNPPRQTEDPQSPPCVPFWDGDNGGATAKGVTDKQIVLMAPCDGECPAAQRKSHEAYANYLNRRFEFYGRKLVIKFMTNGTADCANQKAAATAVDTELQPFAVLDSNAPEDACFYQEAARRGIISGVTNDLLGEAEMQSVHPYLWQYSMAYEGLLEGIGEMICARLYPGNATYSPDPQYQISPRKFGVVLQPAERDGNIPLGALERSMAKCGATVADKQVLVYKNTSPDAPQQSQRAVLALQDAGVNSVICLCWIFREQYVANAATNQNYFPEWIMSSYGGNDTGHLKTFWTPEQRRGVIGLTSRPPSITRPNDPACYAMTEGDPTVVCQRDAGGGAVTAGTTNTSEDGKEVAARGWNTYRTMLLLASGIQMAGPNLTPETFAAALQSTKFPYPADDPTNAGDVGFLDGDHSMTDTFAEWWWDETATAPDDTRGMFCYVDNARRRRVGAWPQEDEPFRKQACDTYGDV